MPRFDWSGVDADFKQLATAAGEAASYPSEFRSKRNKHAFTGGVDNCVHCGQSVWELPECFSELVAVRLGMRRMGGCVTLPLPVSAAEVEARSLPIPAPCQHNSVWAETARTVEQLQRQMALGTEYECVQCGEVWREKRG